MVRQVIDRWCVDQRYLVESKRVGIFDWEIEDRNS